jgi:hypothetical protein
LTLSNIALLADAALVLRVESQVHSAVAPWIPLRRTPANDDRGTRATLTIHALDERGAPRVSLARNNDVPPTLTLGAVAAHVDGDRASLAGPSGIHGDIELSSGDATLWLDPTTPLQEIHGALTLTSALLLGRMGRALVHAAAVVDPSGDGWLLVGDSHSGKTTTCATLIAAGWRYVADDQVVITESNDVLTAEGWPRVAHLDRGWSSAEVTRVRVEADLTDIQRDGWTAAARLRGVWFTGVNADRPTAFDSIAPADALGRLIRQSPWLLADARNAPSTLALLSRLASLRCASLSLGRDSYAHGETLIRAIERFGNGA